ncbi:MAG: hypothetical protein HWN66_21155 [Candidatus Helarchaeota archaeon]|nr:hypothetical protein [Candidatus Helarchaeota archaeon]
MVGQDLLNVPFDEMVMQLASAIAEGQHKLDLVSIEIAKIMGDREKAWVELPKIEREGPGIDFGEGEETTEKLSLIAAGFIPTFYQFVDSIIEVKMAITMTRSHLRKVSVKARAGWMCFSASVNASYSGKYSYSVEGSSLLRTKIVPVPIPKMLEERLKAIVDAQLQTDKPVPSTEEADTIIE